MDWIEKYMPYTYESQPSESWDQIAINGKIYAIPKSKATFTGYNILAVRSDLIEKYNLTEPTSWDNFKKYLKELADIKNETGVTPMATNANRDQLNTMFNQSLKLENLCSGSDWYYYNNDTEKAPKAEDILYYYTSDEYLEYCKLCAELAAQGAWSSDAISDTTDAQAYFENGTSCSFAWNSSVYTAGKNLELANLGTYAVYDITPDTLRRRASYADDAIAIPVNSKNQERAALVLDYIKNDVNLNRLLLGGIEGVHYNLTEEGYRETLDDSTNYPWNGWAWAINRQDEPYEADIDERQIEMDKKIDAKEYHPQTLGFTFDSSTVSSEYAVVNSVRDEYIMSFSLGVYGNKTEETFNTFKKKLESSGVEKVNEEMRRQYNEYLTAKGYN